jgi:hypothetical protein
MKRLAVILTAFVAVFAGTMAPANAGWPGGEILHPTDDAGWNPPIPYRCDGNGVMSLSLGEWSKSECADVNEIYVASGDQIRCQTPFFTWTTYDATGWHAISNNSGRLHCYQQKD